MISAGACLNNCSVECWRTFQSIAGSCWQGFALLGSAASPGCSFVEMTCNKGSPKFLEIAFSFSIFYRRPGCHACLALARCADCGLCYVLQ